MDAFKTGFRKVIPEDCLSGVLAEELELAICGLRVIDVEDWKQNTEYKGEFRSNHTVVRWFWQTLERFTQLELAALLQFVMGTTRLPVEGFRTLRTLRGDSAKFTLEPVQYEGRTQFPRAHTCFNRLDLPLYPCIGELRSSILYVINNHNEGFGLE
jgi:E3 ubiquitin-protein ligase HUWE1